MKNETVAYQTYVVEKTLGTSYVYITKNLNSLLLSWNYNRKRTHQMKNLFTKAKLSPLLRQTKLF